MVATKWMEASINAGVSDNAGSGTPKNQHMSKRDMESQPAFDGAAP
jgi:hypothetical protein